MASEHALGIFELLLAESWLEKCAVAECYDAYLPCIRDTLEEEAYDALRSGNTDDAFIFAAHVALLDDIARCGVEYVRAEIEAAMWRHDHPGGDAGDDLDDDDQGASNR
jgi:hypothetical protein